MSATPLPFPPPNSPTTTDDEISRAAKNGNVIAQLEMIRRVGALNLLDRRAAEQVADTYGYVELAAVLAAYGTAGYLALLETLADWRTTS